MANLRSLIYTLNVPASTNFPTEILIFNTSINVPSNGGQCCLWTVPAGVTWAQFEMWGGGGGGAGACCCQQGLPGGSGSYATRTITVSPGWQYTICAAGTTASSPNCIGCPGNTSYITGCNLSNFCATGGAHGDTHCFWGASNINCNQYANCCCAYGGDFVVHGQRGGYIGVNWCYQYFQQGAPSAPRTFSGPAYGPGGCINGGPNGNCLGWFPCATYFPGGGGMSAQSHGGNCWCGGWGAGGLITVTYG